MAAHLGAVRLDRQAADPRAQVLAVGETLAVPVRLLAQAEAGGIVVSPEVGRMVNGWVALEERLLPLRDSDPTHLHGYVVVGVSPGREGLAGRQQPTRSPFVARLREVLLLEGLLALLETANARAGTP